MSAHLTNRSTDEPTPAPDLAHYAAQYADQGYVLVKGLLSRED
jgi:hypothetical protein